MSRWTEGDLQAYLEKRRGKTAAELYAEVRERNAAVKASKKRGKKKAAKRTAKKRKQKKLEVRTGARVTRCKAERDEDGVLRLELPAMLYNGNNGQTKHFGATATLRRVYGEILRECYQKPTETPEYAQELVVTRVLGKGQRLWDADSILRGSAKQLVDAVVDYGFLHDDGPQWVSSALGRQDDTRREDGPMVVLELRRSA